MATTASSHGNGIGSIWMDDVKCTGTESRLSECVHRGWGMEDCDHHEDAGVWCFERKYKYLYSKF